jgi:sodium transport system permease protein
MFTRILAVYRKEFLDTIRDRKTLIFMLLLPTIITPALMLGFAKLSLSMAQKNAVETVTVVASQETQEYYKSLAHQYFLESKTGKFLNALRSPIAQYVMPRRISLDIARNIPKAVFEDPNRFHLWTKQIAENYGDPMGGFLELESQFEDLKSDQFTETMMDTNQLKGWTVDTLSFYHLFISSLGLVQFVEPNSLTTSYTPEDLEDMPEKMKSFEKGESIYAALKEKKIDAFLYIPSDPLTLRHKPLDQMEVSLYYDSTIPMSHEARSRLRNLFSTAGHQIVLDRLADQGYTENFTTPVRYAENTNLVSKSQIAMFALGGILPYLVITFAFLGGMYPAIDLGAGEKERQTLETLLLAPISRTEIALGKFLLIFTTSLLSALLGITTMAVCFQTMVPQEVLQALNIQIDPVIALSIGLLIIPTSAVFAGVLLTLSIFARSFREAQNYLSPMALVAILPASAGLIPGTELSTKMAMIPLVNISLLSRDFLKGDVNWGYYAIAFTSCFALAIICVSACVWMFRRESVLFRS